MKKSVLSIYERILEACRFANQELKEITKKLYKNGGFFDIEENEENTNNPLEFIKKKRDNGQFDMRKSFVKKKKI